MKRSLFSFLFVSIALLLLARVGLHLWPNSAHSGAIVASSNIASSKIESVPVRKVTVPVLVQPEVSAADDSWALLESYLIPEVKAAAADATTQTSVIDDETLTELRQFRVELEQRSKKLDVREQALQKAEEQLKQRITELEQLEASIQQRLVDESKVKSKKIKRLTAVYEGMKPEKAAPVIAKMELATVVKIFLLMDEKKVGKILSFLPPDKAVTISQALTRKISSVQ